MNDLMTNKEFRSFVRFTNDIDLMLLSVKHHNHELGILNRKHARILQGEIYKREAQSKQWRDMFLDWFNNFLTIERFAEYYGITETYARIVIKEGKRLHEEYVEAVNSERCF